MRTAQLAHETPGRLARGRGLEVELTSLGRPLVVAGFALSISGRFSAVHRGLEVVSDGQDRNVREVYSQTADRLRLSEADRQELIPSGTQRLLDNRLGWAKTYLLKAGLVESPRRAVIRITQRGREALAGNDRIDSRYLRRFPEFLEFIRGNEGDDGGEKPPIPPPTPPETTPEELIETGYRQVQSALASELLERVKTATPTFFEQLVVRLLVAMGYGGSMEMRGRPSADQVMRASTGSSRRTVWAWM